MFTPEFRPEEVELRPPELAREPHAAGRNGPRWLDRRPWSRARRRRSRCRSPPRTRGVRPGSGSTRGSLAHDLPVRVEVGGPARGGTRGRRRRARAPTCAGIDPSASASGSGPAPTLRTGTAPRCRLRPASPSSSRGNPAPRPSAGPAQAAVEAVRPRVVGTGGPAALLLGLDREAAMAAHVEERTELAVPRRVTTTGARPACPASEEHAGARAAARRDRRTARRSGQNTFCSCGCRISGGRCTSRTGSVCSTAE